ncbi:hypothetical protein ACFVV7_37080 [Streptomyces globisporus]|uniref:hypothetical protein n=1 Tax=Streptomyces globisporus TaxID=1908 RepID=UPI0036D915F0
MLNDDDLYDAEYRARCRQDADLRHIAAYYGLEQRFGIRVAIGGRVLSHGTQGTIVDTAGQYLRILFDGEESPRVRQVTSGMAYETAAGWVAALRVPDPCPTPQ